MFKIKNILNELFLLTNYRTLTNILDKYRIRYDILIKHLKEGDIKYVNIFGKKLIKFKSFLNFFQKNYQDNYIHSIKVDDFEFKMSFLDNLIDEPIFERIQGRREPSTVAILKSLIKEDYKILEIGACYGYFTLIMSKILGLNGEIVSIECLPRNYKILKNNLKMNDIKNVKALNFFINSNNKTDVNFKKNSKNPYEMISNLNENISDVINKDENTHFEKVETIELSKLCKILILFLI